MIYQIEFLMFGGSGVVERINADADDVEQVKRQVVEMVKSRRGAGIPDLLRPAPSIAYQIRENGGDIVFEGTI